MSETATDGLSKPAARLKAFEHSVNEFGRLVQSGEISMPKTVKMKRRNKVENIAFGIAVVFMWMGIAAIAVAVIAR